MIPINLENRNNLNLHEYIYESIKNQIQEGLLKANEKLPSKRNLASHLGVSVITVQNAYLQLIDEGYIYSIEKKGFFVTDISSEFKEYKASVHKTKAQPVNESDITQDFSKEFIADFTSNSTNVEKFPFSLWSSLSRRVLKSGDEKLLSSVNVQGVLELRCAIANHLKSFCSMNVNPSNIIIGAGTENLFSLLVPLLGREKIYAVENPGYHKVSKVISANGASFIPVKIDSQGIDVEALKKNCASVVHISPSHHFPTGTVMTVKRRLELLSWAKKNKAYIIEDEYDSEFRFNTKPPLPLFARDPNGCVIYINTFTKTLSPSFRISYMILPDKLMSDFQKKLGFYSCSVSAFEQYTLSQFINLLYYEKHIIRMKNYYRNLRNEFISALQHSKLSEISFIEEENSGLHFLLTVKSNEKAKSIQTKLLDSGIKIALLSDFSYNSKNERKGFITFVVNYSSLKKEKIFSVVKILESVFIPQ